MGIEIGGKVRFDFCFTLPRDVFFYILVYNIMGFFLEIFKNSELWLGFTSGSTVFMSS